jgi:hypothetical protein
MSRCGVLEGVGNRQHRIMAFCSGLADGARETCFLCMTCRFIAGAVHSARTGG